MRITDAPEGGACFTVELKAANESELEEKSEA